MPFIVFIFFVILVILICPIKIVVTYSADDKDVDVKALNNVKIYILYFIKIKTIKQKKGFKGKKYKKIIKFFKDNIKNFDDTERKLKLLTNNKILKKFNDSIKYKKVDLQFGFNLKDYILNAYVLTIITTILNMYVGANSNKFNMNKLNLDVYINQSSAFKIKLFSIIELSFVNTIIILINILFKKMKRRIKQWRENNILLKT